MKYGTFIVTSVIIFVHMRKLYERTMNIQFLLYCVSLDNTGIFFLLNTTLWFLTDGVRCPWKQSSFSFQEWFHSPVEASILRETDIRYQTPWVASHRTDDKSGGYQSGFLIFSNVCMGPKISFKVFLPVLKPHAFYNNIQFFFWQPTGFRKGSLYKWHCWTTEGVSGCICPEYRRQCKDPKYWPNRGPGNMQ